MPQFLDKSNDCAQKLLQLVSKGTVVIAELMYLSDNIPESLLRYNDPNNPESQILFDFGFFGLEQIEEDKIDADEVLFQLDEDFRETHEDIVARFYRLFHSIYSFHLELSEWIEDLQNDVFIQQTLEVYFYAYCHSLFYLMKKESKSFPRVSIFLVLCFCFWMKKFLVPSVRR